jgi:hypothetical protein
VSPARHRAASACPDLTRSAWLATDHEQLSTSLARFIGIDGYGVGTLRDDLARFMFLLGETDGEGLFSPRTAELTEPAVFPAPDAG